MEKIVGELEKVKESLKNRIERVEENLKHTHLAGASHTSKLLEEKTLLHEILEEVKEIDRRHD